MSAEPSDSALVSSLGPQLPFQLGRFTLCKEIGAGGMATVYLSRMQLAAGLERLVALKTIHGHLAKEKQFLDMFLDEAKIASQISHPNVCAVYDFGHEGNVYYIAMEYLVGEPLFDLVNACVDQKNDELLQAVPFLAARVLADACEGLHAAHTLRGQDGKPLHVVHRDVSPQNLFVTYEGSVKVVDFGCAKALERVTQTNTGMMKGKVSYAAPEQLKSEEMDHRVDVFALGVCLWEALTLRQLFRRETAIKTAMAVLEERIPRATEGADWVPEALADIAAKALERDPEKRYATAREMGRALRTFIASSATPFEAAEVAEWMRHLFEDRHASTMRLVAEVEGMELSKIARVPEVRPKQESEEKKAALANEPTKLAKTTSKPSRGVEAADSSVWESHDAPMQGLRLDEDPVELPTRRWPLYLALLVLVAAIGGGAFAWWRYPTEIRTALGMESPPAPAPRVEPEQVAAHEEAHAQVIEPPPAVEQPPAVEEPPPPPPEVAPEPVAQEAPPPQPQVAARQAPQRAPEREPEPEEAEEPPPIQPQGRQLDFSRGPVYLTTPGGWALVMHEGREIGRTPLRTTLPVGRQTLRLLPYGRGPAREVNVNVVWGELRTVNVGVAPQNPPPPQPRRGTESDSFGNPY